MFMIILEAINPASEHTARLGVTFTLGTTS